MSCNDIPHVGHTFTQKGPHEAPVKKLTQRHNGPNAAKWWDVLQSVAGDKELGHAIQPSLVPQ